MTVYELMIKTNHYLIKGGSLTEAQRENIVNQFLSVRSSKHDVEVFKKGVNSPENQQSTDKRIMYPLFYIPPYNNGKKLKTIFFQTSKTHILSSNMYELEILRLLFILSTDNEAVNNMIKETLSRLKTTCFGYKDDGLGECFDTSLIVLRFLASAAPSETEWILSRIENYNNHVNEKKRPWFSLWYYWLCLSELPFDIAKPEIEKYKAEMLNWLTNKSCVMNSEQDKTIQPVRFCALRNVIANYPEYEYIKDRQPYISEKDGRLYFPIKR